MVAFVIVITNKSLKMFMELTGQIIVVQYDLVLHRSMPSFNLFLSLWVVRPPSGMCHASLLQIVREFS
jgi:hypothetical protein